MKRLSSRLWLCFSAFWLMAALPVHAQLRLVTVVPAAANHSFPDEDGDFPAYIEIKSLETGILSGHYLSDQASISNKWQVPAGYIMAPGQTLRIFASGKDRRPVGPGGVLHTSFTYDCLVLYCGLFNTKQVLVDTFTDRIDHCGCSGLQLLEPHAIARYLVPTADLGLDWTLPGFNDQKWSRGPTGMGYEVDVSPYQSGLLLYHTFDKGTVSGKTVPDVSGPVLHDGTLVGTPIMVQGRVSEGFDFKADASSHVRVAHHAELDPGTNPFSVAVWFRPTRGGGVTGTPFQEVLVSKQTTVSASSPTTTGWSIYRTLNGTFAQVASTVGTRTVALGVSAVGQWNHAVLVVDRASSELVGYLNGKRIGVAALSGGVGESISAAVDLFEARDAAGGFPFSGVLDDLAIWGAALSDAQVAQLYSVGQSGKSLLDGAVFSNTGKLYAGLIGTDVQSRMHGINTSLYLRVPFNLPSVPSIATGLKLRVHSDDGFVAYLNGAEVARRNAPTALDNLAAAEADRPDAAAIAADEIDLTSYIGLLKPGGNLLAFHALSHDAGASRFLIAPSQLCLQIDKTTTPPTGECIKETNGRDFWVAFPENYAQEPDTPLRLTLTITGTPQTQGVVDIPGLTIPGFPRNFTLPVSGAINVTLPAKVELSGADAIEPKGVHIVTSADVAVYGTTRMDYTTDAFLALPTKCLGTQYLVCSYRNVFQGLPILNGTQFAVVAVANGTEVTITPPIKVGKHPAKQAYIIKLNRGETYQLRDEDGAPADLTGTEVAANKPIGVFGSHRCANVQSVSQFFCDTVLEELLPVSSWGTDFFVVPLATRKSDTVRILSGADGNLVTVSASGSSQSFTLARGAFKDLSVEQATRILSRGPSFVVQFANSSDFDHVTNADPFMTLIQPASTWMSRYQFVTPPAADFAGQYINLVATTQTTLESTTINGVPVSAWSPAEIVRGTFPTGAAFARVKLDPATAYLVVGRAPIGLTVYGFSEYDSYGYPGGMRFTDSSAPILVCPKPVTLSCQSTGLVAGCLVAVPDLTLKTEVFDDCTSPGRILLTQNPKAGTQLKPGSYSVTITATDGQGNQSQCSVSLVIESKWTEQKFGAAVAANPALEATVWGAAADPDKDGIPNALEQALGSDPTQATSLGSLVVLGTETGADGAFPVVSLPRLADDAGPALELEGAGSLDGSAWQSGPDLFEELPALSAPIGAGKFEKVVFRIRLPAVEGNTSSYFLRLKTKP